MKKKTNSKDETMKNRQKERTKQQITNNEQNDATQITLNSAHYHILNATALNFLYMMVSPECSKILIFHFTHSTPWW